MEREKVAPSVPGAVGLHHPRWDNSVSPVLVTQCTVVCDSTLSEILQRAYRLPMPPAPDCSGFQWRIPLHFLS